MDQEMIMKMQENYQMSKQLEEQLEFVDQQIEELRQFDEGMEAMENSKEKEILAGLGKGIFVKADIKEDELFVDVGAGVFVKKTKAEARSVIESQVKRLGEIKFQLNEQLRGIAGELEEFMKEIQKAQGN